MKKYIIFLIAMICLVYGYSAKAEEICTKEDGKLICTEPSVITFQKTRDEVVLQIDRLERERQRERSLLNQMLEKAHSKKDPVINAISAEIEFLKEKLVKMDELQIALNYIIAPLPPEEVVDVAKE